jgi:hypothetical protein
MGLRDFFSGVRDFGKEVRACCEEIKSLQLELADLQLAPPARTDVKDLFARWIDGCEGKFLEMLQQRVATISRKGAYFGDLEAPQIRNSMCVVSVPPNGSNPATPATMDVALMALFGEQLKPLVMKALDKLEWPAQAMTQKDISARMTEIGARLATLRAKREEMIGEARKHGLIVDLDE